MDTKCQNLSSSDLIQGMGEIFVKQNAFWTIFQCYSALSVNNYQELLNPRPAIPFSIERTARGGTTPLVIGSMARRNAKVAG